MIKLHTGDVLKCLAKLPDESVQCVVTSPPYWGLRDYGVSGQIGLEPTPEAFVAKMVAVFREVKRVLRPDGTCWVNLGDSYATQSPIRERNQVGYGSRPSDHPLTPKPSDIGLKPKDLVGIPWRVAFALQADGWYLRSDIIWHKPNPMPESVRDRPTKSHEYVFLLTKRARYYYDADAVREGFADSRMGNPNGGGKYVRDLYPDNPHAQSGLRSGIWTKGAEQGGRNSRSVWTITPKPFKGAHFATFPPALVERCVKAGTSERGACPTCGAPWERVVERTAMILRRSERTHEFGHTRSSGTMLEPPSSKTLGWRPACDCPAAEPVPCTVLDPFSGAGTVALVCDQLGRDAIGIDLNPAYNAMARKRIAAAQAQQVEAMSA